MVSHIEKIDNMNYIEWENGEFYSTEIINDKFIRTIVTKQQFESIQYKI